MPPSSDRFVRQPKSLRAKSEKSSGGQEGHQGKHLMMVETPDLISVYPATIRACCQHDVSQEPVEKFSRRQVFDLPIPKMMVVLGY